MRKSNLVTISISIILFFTFLTTLSAVEVKLLESKQYLRNSGKPDVYTDTFPGRVGTATILIKNGEEDGSKRVSSAEVLINGEVIFKTKDFNQTVYELTQTVNLIEGNEISVELNSAPGSYITVEISQEVEADAAKIIGSEGGEIKITDTDSPILGYSVSIPSGALDIKRVISIAYEPEINIPLNDNLEEGKKLPSFYLLPDDLVFNKPVKISVPYPDQDNDGIVDGTTIPIDFGNLYFLNEENNQFRRIESRVDLSSKCIIGEAIHFSLWSLFYSRWNIGAKIKYYIESIPGNTYSTIGSFLDDIKEAFSQWSESINKNILFERTSTLQEANIIIKSGSLNEPEAYGAADRVMFPIGNKIWTVTFNSDIVYNSFPNEWWSGDYSNFPYSDNPSKNYLPFLRLALHEFGHVMGLDDYSQAIYTIPYIWRFQGYDPCNDCLNINNGIIMYYECSSSCTQTMPITKLHDFDKTEVRKLYNISAPQNVVYSEDFQSDPNYMNVQQHCYISQCVYWDSQNGNFYARVYDTSSNDVVNAGFSPLFNEVVTSQDDFTIEFDINPVSPNWGTYPGIFFVSSKNGSAYSKYLNDAFALRFLWTDKIYKKFRFYDPNGNYYDSPTIPAANEFYQVKITYSSNSKTVNMTMVRKSNGSMFFLLNNVPFNITDEFDQIMIGGCQRYPRYGTSSAIRVDNINIKKD